MTSTITKSLFAFALVLGLLMPFTASVKATEDAAPRRPGPAPAGVLSAVEGPSAPAGANGLEVRIMTFNIRYGSANDGQNHWKNRREMVFDVIRKQQSDVIGLQEALRFQIDEIRQALPMYGEIGVAREDGKINGEYSAILYHRPLRGGGGGDLLALRYAGGARLEPMGRRLRAYLHLGQAHRE
jgi:hypothetical protein